MRAWYSLRAMTKGEHDACVPERERRLSLALALLATVWFALAAAWGLFGPHLGGHYAASASVGIAADNMLHWGIAGPVWEYTASRPPPSSYYCHHPWGIFWTTAAFMKLFGRHDFVCRLPAVLLSAATPPLLYLLGRALWRPAAGAAAAAAFVVLPITLAFAGFNALEVPVTTWSLLALWAHVRHVESGRRRWLVLSLAGFALALHADWPAYVLLGGVLACALGRGVLFGRARGDARALLRWWVLAAILAAVTLAFYLVVFERSGALGELLASYRFRARGRERPLLDVLAARRYWIELSFTPVALVAMAVATVCSIGRALARRDAQELLPLAVLVMAAVQYLAFPQGADIHVFWPHYFAAFFALGTGALCATALGWLEKRRRWARRAAPMALGGVLALLAPVLRDGVPALAYAHATGGRFNEKGLYIASDGDKTAMLRWLAPTLAPDAEVAMHAGMRTTWSQMWTLARVVRQNETVAALGRGADVFLADARWLEDASAAHLFASHRVTAVGPYWLVRRGEPPGPLDAFRFDERAPTRLEWYLTNGTEPVRTVAPDPFLGWELAHHFGSPVGSPVEPPRAEPRTLEERRIAHNAAVAAGDPMRAAALAAEILTAFAPVGAPFAGGAELRGVRFEPGACSWVTLLFLAAGPVLEAEPALRSRVVARAPWSTTMADPTVREIAPPALPGARRWRAGYLYALRVPVRKRPGTEVFELYGRAPSGAPARGVIPVEVLRLR
jgi:4-amino-4-deoxy-L-arabinose transferase-like glycosyltransferase